MIKNLVTFSLIIFTVAIIGILGAGVFINQNSAITAPILRTSATLSAAEVAKHNTIKDCWTIVNSKAYNVTSFISVHSGGPEKIIAYCGKDATSAFNMGPHSQRSQNILDNYYVGNIN